MSESMTIEEQEALAEATADENPAAEVNPASPGEAVAATEAKRKSEPTSYVILEKIAIATPGEDDHYVVVTKGVVAQGADAAVRKAADSLEGITETPRYFLAVPTRSWREIPVSVETKKQLKLG